MHGRFTMNAIKLLKDQHQEVRDLFDLIEKADDDDEKQTLVEQLADNLAAHATIEEKLFYPAAYAKATKELLTEAVEEHLSMKRILADLMELSPDHENVDAKINVLKEQVDHHVDEEETEIFKAARKEIEAAELERLGEEMQRLFDEEMEGEPSDAIRAQTNEAAPLR